MSIVVKPFPSSPSINTTEPCLNPCAELVVILVALPTLILAISNLAPVISFTTYSVVSLFVEYAVNSIL